MSKTVAVVLAAGQGKRMNSSVTKQFLKLDGKPIVYYSLKVFEDSFIDEVILVTGETEIPYCREEIVEKYGLHKVKQIVVGGKERYHSVHAGVMAATGADYIFVHDGARPFITKEILQRAYDTVKIEDACVVAVPSKDTVKIIDENGYVTKTPNRDRIWNMQTPQVFEYRLIKNAYDTLIWEEDKILAEGIQITDDAMVVETFMKQPVKIVEGSYENIKITTPEDLALAEIILKK